jgi:hypothetical protein
LVLLNFLPGFHEILSFQKIFLETETGNEDFNLNCKQHPLNKSEFKKTLEQGKGTEGLKISFTDNKNNNQNLILYKSRLPENEYWAMAK